MGLKLFPDFTGRTLTETRTEGTMTRRMANGLYQSILLFRALSWPQPGAGMVTRLVPIALCFTFAQCLQFLPVIGRLVSDLLEENLDADTVKRFLYGRPVLHKDTSRIGRPQELDLETLWTPEGLP